MPINITMPALSPTMEEGNLAKWLVKEGDKVKSGDVIAEIETDKATMEVEAVDEGTVAKIVVPAGTEGVKVNALIAVLAADGEDAGAAAKGGASAGEGRGAIRRQSPHLRGRCLRSRQREALSRQPRKPMANGKAARVPRPRPLAAGRERLPHLRLAARPPHRQGCRRRRRGRQRLRPAWPRRQGRRRGGDRGGGAKAAPAAKPAAGAAPAAAPAVKPMSDEAVLKLFEPGSYELVPHDNMRKTIARRLVEAKSTIPHFYLTLDCEIDALLALRAQLNAAAPVKKTDKGEVPTYKLSVNDMIIKAMALALRDVPDANASWTDTAMVKHKHADVGVAVSIPGGLITPIIRHADEKTLSAISNEMKDLAARARNRKLKPEEYQGGTTAVSNLGMFGIKDFSAVINPPHATILAVGAGEERAVVKKGAIVVANMMSVTLSTDHRAVDGALGAELLVAFKRYIENPMGMLV